jgi:hypothetical protein
MAHKGAERVLIPCVASGVINAGYGVKLSAATGNNIIVEECDTAGEFCFGIAEATVADGKHVDVCVWGRTKAKTGANPTFKAGVTVAADGTVTDVDGSNDYHLGIFVDDVGSGEWATVFVGMKILDQDGQ